MSTANGPEEYARENGMIARMLAGLVRRASVALTNSSVWQVLGAQLPSGLREVIEAEAFTGIGFYARPPSASKVEAMLVFPNGAAVPVVIAARDEDVRRKVAADLKPDETQAHNSKTIIRIKADGTVEIRAATGEAGPVAKHSDMQALAEVLSDWVVVGGDGGGALKTLIEALIASGWPHGTSKLKAQ